MDRNRGQGFFKALLKYVVPLDETHLAVVRGLIH